MQVPRTGLHAANYVEWAFSATGLSESYSYCLLFEDLSVFYCDHCWLSVLVTHFKFMKSCKEMLYKHSQKLFYGEVFLSLDQWFPARGISPQASVISEDTEKTSTYFMFKRKIKMHITHWFDATEYILLPQLLQGNCTSFTSVSENFKDIVWHFGKCDCFC